MATKVWKGFLKFGMLTIPVYLNVGARDQRVSLSNFHSKCNGFVRSPKYCQACDEMIPADEIFRGFDTGNGIAKITDEELESITPATDKVMEVSECVNWSEIDSAYLAESFYLLPDAAGAKAYALLTKTLTDSGKVGIAQLTKSSREHVVVLRPKGNGLMLHYMWYSTEVARVPEFDALQPGTFTQGEIKLATQLVETMSAEFDPEQYEDAYFQRLNTLIASKMDKTVQAPTPVKATASAPTQDLMAALSASLASAPKRAIKLEHSTKTKGKKVGKKVA